MVGYGCMTCIGNSGPLPECVVEAITQVLLRVLFFLKSCVVAILHTNDQNQAKSRIGSGWICG